MDTPPNSIAARLFSMIYFAFATRARAQAEMASDTSTSTMIDNKIAATR